jgi:fumarate reductase subunit C
MYQKAWKNLRRAILINRILLGAWIAVGLTSMVTGSSVPRRELGLQSAPYVLCLIVITVTLQILRTQLMYFTCPRCKRPFFLDNVDPNNPTQAQRPDLNTPWCVHCKLHKWAADET